MKKRVLGILVVLLTVAALGMVFAASKPPPFTDVVCSGRGTKRLGIQNPNPKGTTNGDLGGTICVYYKDAATDETRPTNILFKLKAGASTSEPIPGIIIDYSTIACRAF